MPWHANTHYRAVQNHFVMASRGGCSVNFGEQCGSLLTHNFNGLWATALNYAAQDVFDYWLLHHADVETRTPGFVDVMVAEMQRTGAAVLSAVVPIKDDSGYHSTAVETRFPWVARKLTFRECDALPTTFGAADIPDGLSDMALPKRLLVNTGLMLVDLKRPEFHRVNDVGELDFVFTINDRIAREPGGMLVAQVWPEDWEFSRRCNAAGLPVYATKAVQVIHHGTHGWANYAPDEEGVQ